MKGTGTVRHGGSRAWMLAGVTVMVAGALSVVVASAGGDSSGVPALRDTTTEGHITYVSRQKDVPFPPDSPDGRTSALVDCPASHPHLTGGGIDTSGGSLAVDVEVGSTGPATRRSWLGEANNDTQADASMTVTAICKKVGKFRYHDASKSNPSGDQILKGSNCPAGTKLTGGGVETNGDHSVEVASSEPADGPDKNSKRDDRWVGAANGGSMTVTAICAKRGTAGIYRYKESDRKELPNNSITTAFANCPSGFVVTGGGVDVSGIDDDLEVKASSPLEGGGWLGQAINDGSGQDEKMQAFAICKKKR
jgi:hypothetical protein